MISGSSLEIHGERRSKSSSINPVSERSRNRSRQLSRDQQPDKNKTVCVTGVSAGSGLAQGQQSGSALKMKTFDLGWDGTFGEKVEPVSAGVPNGMRVSGCGQFLIDSNGDWHPNPQKPPSRVGSRGHGATGGRKVVQPQSSSVDFQTSGVSAPTLSQHSQQLLEANGLEVLTSSLSRPRSEVKHGRRASGR